MTPLVRSIKALVLRLQELKENKERGEVPQRKTPRLPLPPLLLHHHPIPPIPIALRPLGVHLAQNHPDRGTRGGGEEAKGQRPKTSPSLPN